MSAAPAHAPSHPTTAPSAAPSAAPAAANNAMHFKHGGVLGLTESIARLVKGVTYDAAMDTFAHPANNPNMGAAHPTDGAHPAPHPAPHPTPTADGAHPAPHPAPAAADGAHPAPHPAPAAGHDGHDDDDDSISGSIIKGLSHMGHYGAAFPVLAKGLKWAKDKMFPEIHEIPTEDQHVGDQILHKLKKNKKNKTELDHHALDGFCKGLDIANLGRTFRMFTDPIRFEAAVKREAGREEIRKEIANILDLSGEVDRGEVVTQVNLLLHLLGHHVDSRVANQHHALVEIIRHVEAWLTEPVLAKIYGTEAKEADFTMDYDKIGDSVLKVNDKSLRPFLNRIKTDGIDDVEVKVGDLLDHTNVTAELEHNPGDLREQIENLFNVKGKVTRPKLEERVRQMKKRLKYEIVPPAVAIAPIDPYTEIRKEFVELLDKALANLSAATLSELYPLAEDTGTKFEWTDAKYKDFGATVLTTVTDKNRVAALKGFDVETLNTIFTGVLPSIKPAALSTDAGRKKIREQASTLLRLTEPFDAAEIAQQVTALKKRLGDGTVEGVKFAEVAARLDAAATALTATGVIDKLFPPEEDTGTKFEWTDAKYKDFGATVLTTVKPKNQAEALKGFDAAVFNATFNAILPTVKPAALATEPGRNKIKEQAVALFRLSEPFDAAEVTQQADALRAKMTVSPSTPEADVFKDRIDKAEAALTAAGLIDKLFEDGGTKFEWTDAKYKDFGATVLTTVKPKNQAEALKGFDEDTFDATFNLLSPAPKTGLLDTTDGKKRVKNQLIALFKLEEPFEASDLDRQADTLRKRLGLAKASPATHPLDERLQAIVGALNTDMVNKLFAGVSPVGPDNFVGTFRDLETADEVAAYIRGYKSSNFRGHFAYLVDSDEMNEVVRHGAPEDKNRAKAQVREFVGQDIGNVRLTALQAVLKEFEDQIKLVPESSLSVPDQARHQALVKDLADVKKVLETEDGLNRLFKGEKVEAVEPKLSQLGKQIYALSDKELESYLEKLSDMGPDMITRFTAIKDPTLKTGRVISKPEAARIKKALAELLGVQPKSALTFVDVRSLVTAIAAKLQSPAITMQLQKNPKAATGQQLILNNLSHALNNLDDNVLKQVY